MGAWLHLFEKVTCVQRSPMLDKHTILAMFCSSFNVFNQQAVPRPVPSEPSERPFDWYGSALLSCRAAHRISIHHAFLQNRS